MATISGRSGASVTPGTGLSGSSKAARSRPRAADFASASAAPSTSPSGQPESGMRGHSILSAPGVGLAVGGIVEHGKGVVEQVRHAYSEPVEEALCGAREVGAARAVARVLNTVIENPRWNTTRATVYEIETTGMADRLWR